MSNYNQEIKRWEAFGGISLLGLCISSLYSYSFFAEHQKFLSTKSISPEEILKSPKDFSNKLIKISGTIYTPDSSIVYSYKQIKSCAYLSTFNQEESLLVFFI